jgi:hypothetical protein
MLSRETPLPVVPLPRAQAALRRRTGDRSSQHYSLFLDLKAAANRGNIQNIDVNRPLPP